MERSYSYSYSWYLKGIAGQLYSTFRSLQTPPPKEYPTLAGWVRDGVVQNASLGTAVAKRKLVAFTGKQTSVL